MNNDLFNLDIFADDDIFNSISYDRFSLCLESLELLLSDDIFTEAMRGTNKGMVSGIKDAAGKARKGTNSALEVYGDMTDAGGALIDSIYQLTINSLALITKIVKFILTNLSKIPLLLAKLIKKLTKLPASIHSKIKGSIELYITVRDLPVLENEIMKYLDDFLILATSFTKGDNYNKSNLFKFKENDFKAYDKLNDIYKRLQKLKFEKSTILLNDTAVIHTYISSDSEYYIGINKVLELMNNIKPKLGILIKSADSKFNANQIKGNIAELTPANQLKARNSIQMISKVVEITGNIMKYMIADISTIDKAITTLMKSDKKNLMDKN